MSEIYISLLAFSSTSLWMKNKNNSRTANQYRSLIQFNKGRYTQKNELFIFSVDVVSDKMLGYRSY
jgi:hypothetical protein